MTRISDRNDWFELWFSDKQSMINTMLANMKADLEAGYNYFGKSITEQRNMIDAYKQEFDNQVDEFKHMEDKEVNRWCFYDMKKRGAIE
ncbi:MAG: hypothetical protein MJY71_07980 [Bacteroidaceae bacterium]|nr:hypothetical protein [Bacteroidaceae bacterium]